MTISATIIADSISPADIRLTTMQLRYPRFIHSEFMTHRVFSRNASSSRAIPVEKMIEDLRRDPAMPIFWGSNKPGMQAGEELTSESLEAAKSRWIEAMNDAIRSAELLMLHGLHKQIANRILEPWAHINVVVSATDWDNFYELRRHPDAQPEIHELADKMYEAQQASTPKFLQPGEWHLPYVRHDDISKVVHLHNWGNPHAADVETNQDLIKVSVARCARVSYLTHDGRETTVEEDIKLYDRLVGSVPLHASPAEHQATPDERYFSGTDNGQWKNSWSHGNFSGWIQYRKTIEDA